MVSTAGLIISTIGEVVSTAGSEQGGLGSKPTAHLKNYHAGPL